MSLIDFQEIVFLTDSQGEAISEGLRPLEDAGIEAGTLNGKWYPLTPKEYEYIEEGLISFHELAQSGQSYTALYNGKKCLAYVFEFMIDEEDPDNQQSKEFLEIRTAEFAMKVNGFFAECKSSYDRSDFILLIPFDYIHSNSKDYNGWFKHIERVGLKAFAYRFKVSVSEDLSGHVDESDYPDVANLEITFRDKQKLLKNRDALTLTDMYRGIFSDSYGDWLNEDGDEIRMECEFVAVREDSFSVHANPKYLMIGSSSNAILYKHLESPSAKPIVI